MVLLVDVVAAGLTIMVLSRIVGDNFLFRIAQYLFVGVSLGLAFVVAYHQVLRPAFDVTQSSGGSSIVRNLVPLLLGFLLLFRITKRQQYSWLANLPLALVFGVGSALAIGGAIVGSLLPQIFDTARPLNRPLPEAIGTIVLAVGTVVTLGSFYYTVPPETRSGRLVAIARLTGHWLLMVAFGFFFADALQTYLSALIERLSFLLDQIR